MRSEIRANRDIWADVIELRYGEHKGENWSMAQPLVLQESPRGAVTTPFMALSTEMAQRLIDELWLCGLRPTEGTGSAGAYAAQGRHLEDMRAIVFKGKKP